MDVPGLRQQGGDRGAARVIKADVREDGQHSSGVQLNMNLGKKCRKNNKKQLWLMVNYMNHSQGADI